MDEQLIKSERKFVQRDVSMSVTEDMTVTALYRELPKEEKRDPLPAEQPEKREEKLDVKDELMQTGIDISYIAIAISIAVITSFALYRHLIRNRN